MKTRLVSLDYEVPACGTGLSSLPVLIGSGPDAEIRLNDRTVSHCHCRIEEIDETLVVHDLGSVHGTFVNGTRITESPLLPGDVLSIGLRSFYLRCIEKAVSSSESVEDRSGHVTSLQQDDAQLVGATQ